MGSVKKFEYDPVSNTISVIYENYGDIIYHYNYGTYLPTFPKAKLVGPTITKFMINQNILGQHYITAIYEDN